MNKAKTITFRGDYYAVYEKLQAIAKHQKKSINSLINDALLNFVHEYESNKNRPNHYDPNAIDNHTKQFITNEVEAAFEKFHNKLKLQDIDLVKMSKEIMELCGYRVAEALTGTDNDSLAKAIRELRQEIDELKGRKKDK